MHLFPRTVALLLEQHVKLRVLYSSGMCLVRFSPHKDLTNHYRFQQSDPYWSLTASVTVALIFFRHVTADQIKKFYWLYCILCYGLPAVPAIVLLVYQKTPKFYGSAGSVSNAVDSKASFYVTFHYVCTLKLTMSRAGAGLVTSMQCYEFISCSFLCGELRSVLFSLYMKATKGFQLVLWG